MAAHLSDTMGTLAEDKEFVVHEVAQVSDIPTERVASPSAVRAREQLQRRLSWIKSFKDGLLSTSRYPVTLSRLDQQKIQKATADAYRWLGDSPTTHGDEIDSKYKEVDDIYGKVALTYAG